MIGAGTGVAPFRGFVEERAETGVTSPSWLFFGARNYTNDFLYQLEWQDHLKSRALARIDVAFSRDQPEKIYVQHRLWERRDEIRGWLADGAHVYVCGDEKGLGRDVDATLARILAEPLNGDTTPASRSSPSSSGRPLPARRLLISRAPRSRAPRAGAAARKSAASHEHEP